MRKRSTPVMIGMAVCGIVGIRGVIPSAAQADDTWLGTTSSSWENPANWFTTVPGAGDVAIFPALAAGTAISNPVVDQSDSVAGMSLDNSGGYIWSVLRSGTNADPRTLNIGSMGISLSGGGTTSWTPVATNLAADQTWFVDSGTTLSFGSGATLTGSGNLTKTGVGEVDLSTSKSFNTGLVNIKGGTLENSYSTNGVGSGLVSIFSTATYLLNNSVNNSGGIVMYNGSTLRETGSGNGISLGTLNLDSSANNSVTITTTSGSDLFNFAPGVTGGDSTSIININGNGTVSLNGDDRSSNAFQGTWSVNAGTLRAFQIDSLGDHGAGNTTSDALPSNVTLNGGSVQFAGTSSTSTGSIGFNNPINVTANSTIAIDKQGTAGNASTSYYPRASRVLGNMTIGSSTLTVTNTALITGQSSATYPASFYSPGLTLAGTPTFNIIKPSNFNLAYWFGTITQNNSTYGFNVTGGGNVSVGAANIGFTGPINVTGSSTLQALAKGAFGTGTIIVASGSTALFANGLTQWTSSNSFAGNGLIQVEGGTSSISLAGGTISPGTTSGAAGTLSFAAQVVLGKTAAAANGTLAIDVLGSGGTAGTDFDQVIDTYTNASALSGLGNYNLVVNVGAGITSATTVKIISDPGVTNTAFADMTGGTIGSAFVTPGYSATVSDATSGEVDLTVTPTPEPTSAALATIAMAAIVGRRRRRSACTNR